jgi:hypothetical protein
LEASNQDDPQHLPRRTGSLGAWTGCCCHAGAKAAGAGSATGCSNGFGVVGALGPEGGVGISAQFQNSSPTH